MKSGTYAVKTKTLRALRRRWLAPVAGVQLVVILGVSLGMPTRVWAEDTCGTAQDACTKYEDEAEWIADICKDPDPMPTNVSVEEYQTAKAVCQENAKLGWGQVAPSCKVMEFADLQKQDQIALGTCYAIVSATCFVAYGLQQGGVTGIAGATLGAICGYASIVVGAFDMGFSVGRKNEAKEALGEVGFGDWATGIAGAAVGAAGGITNTVNAAAGGVSKAASSTTNTAEGAAKTLSIVTALATGALAYAKFSSLAGADATKQSACDLIAGEASRSLGVTGSVLTPDTTGTVGTATGAGGGGTATAANQAASGKSEGSGDAFKKALSSPEAFAAAASAAGRLDPKLGEFFKKQPPKELFNQLKAANPNFDKVAMAAAQGSFSGVGAALGDISRKDPVLGKALNVADAELKKRLAALKSKEVQGTQYSGGAAKGAAGTGAGAKGGKGTNPFGGFGLGAAGGGAEGGADALKFGGAAAPQPAAPDSGVPGDIYHQGYSGSLFDIVSHRMGRTRDRVETYEWESPANRLRENLPWKPAHEGLRKPAQATGVGP